MRAVKRVAGAATVLLVGMGLASGPAFASGGASGPVSQVTQAVHQGTAPLTGGLSAGGLSGAAGRSSAGTSGLSHLGSSSSRSGSTAAGQSPSSFHSSSSTGAAGTGGYTPSLHGGQPHGEGTAFATSTEPGATPNSSNCTSPSSDEIAVAGRSCGEQGSDGSYHGHVTVLAAGGQELLGVDSTSAGGSQPTGSFAPLDTAVAQLDGALSQICSQFSGNFCLSLLDANSSTTPTGSTNSFQAASLVLGGPSGVSAGALSSYGNISQNGSCQTANGGSSVATVGAGGTTVADVATSRESSTACRDASQNSQSSSSSVIGGALAPAGAAILGTPGCANGTPNTTVTPLPPMLATIECNATDNSGAQAAAPYGTNEGLTLIALAGLGTHSASAESLARAPGAAGGGAAGPPAPPRTNLTAAVASEASPAPAAPTQAQGQLPLTGAYVLLEALIAFALIGAGVAVRLASRRRLA